MKRFALICLVLILLCGCTADSAGLERAMALRGKIQQKDVTFDATITADYGDKVHTFALQCQGDTIGNMKFVVTAPENIAGITGTVAKGSGKLTFDEKILAFDILADDLISPVSGPWVLLQTLRSGYLTSCSNEGELLRVSIDDSYEKNALHLEVWLNHEDTPQQCEIYWQGRRLLSIDVKNFSFL